MVTDSTLGRRTVLRSSLLGLVAPFVAGCAGTGDRGDGGESTDGTQTTSGPSTATGTDVGTATDTETTQGTTATRTTGSTTTASGDTGAGSNTIVLGGEASGWTGQAPADIDGTVNPTLALQPETTYVLTWVNLDGTRHDLVVADADGNELRSTRPMSGTGATRSLTFPAAPEMAQYYCTFHPRSMRGTVTVGDETATKTGTGTGTGTNANGTRTTSAGTAGAGTTTANASTKPTTN